MHYPKCANMNNDLAPKGVNQVCGRLFSMQVDVSSDSTIGSDHAAILHDLSEGPRGRLPFRTGPLTWSYGSSGVSAFVRARRGSVHLGIMLYWLALLMLVVGGVGYGMHLNSAPRVVYRYRYAKQSASPNHRNHTSATPTPASVSPSISPSIQTTTSPAAKYLLTVNPVFHGSLVNGRLLGTVYVQVTPGGPRYKASVQIDTGAAQTLVDSAFMQTWGGAQNGKTEQISGIGGTETVPYWTHVSIFPAANTTYPMLSNATVAGGLGRTIVGQTGIDVLLGQNVLSHGTLVQKGSTWSFTYAGN